VTDFLAVARQASFGLRHDRVVPSTKHEADHGVLSHAPDMHLALGTDLVYLRLRADCGREEAWPAQTSNVLLVS